MKYKELIIEEIENYLKGADLSDIFITELSPDEVEEKRKLFGGLINSMGDKIYRLPGGGLTGPGGLSLIHKAMKEQFSNNTSVLTTLLSESWSYDDGKEVYTNKEDDSITVKLFNNKLFLRKNGKILYYGHIPNLSKWETIKNKFNIK